jgi:large subunit ribosomal protein L9
VSANEANMAEFESRREELERQQAEIVNAAEARAAKLQDLAIVIAHRAGEEGKLFGSVGAADVAAAITATGTEVERSEVRIAESIRQVGEYTVQVYLHAEVSVFRTPPFGMPISDSILAITPFPTRHQS